MKRLILLMICICCTVTAGFTQENMEPSAIFETYKDSVVMVMQVLYFDPKFSKHPLYIHETEKIFETKLLSAYVPISTGSGLMISPDGYCVTNYHVIENENIEVTKKILYRSFLKAIHSSLHEFSLSRKQVEYLEDDLWSLLQNSDFSYQVRVNDDMIFTPEILEKDEDLDIALLKIIPEDPLVYAEFSLDFNARVGERVVAIGYPFPDILETLFKDHQSTLTVGNISALRDEDWGLQHTAPINPGNSGGPLFNKNGEVIGINVALLRDASNIFFAIPSPKVIDWLESTSHAILKEK